MKVNNALTLSSATLGATLVSGFVRPSPAFQASFLRNNENRELAMTRDGIRIPKSSFGFPLNAISTSEEVSTTAAADLEDTSHAGILKSALSYLTGASLVYLYAELRQLAYAGFTETEFDDIDCDQGAILTAESIMATLLRERYWAVALDSDGKEFKDDEQFRNDTYILELIDNDLMDSINYGINLVQGTPREGTETDLLKEIQKLRDRVASNPQQPAPTVQKTEVEDIEEKTGSFLQRLLEGDADKFPDNGNKKLISLIKEFSNTYLVPESLFNSVFRDDVELVHFSDRYPQKECVWGLTVNRSTKQITVIFRGSVNTNDWTKDLQIKQDEVANPVKGLDCDKIGVHFGFHAFLQRQRQNWKYGNTKFKEIMHFIEETYKNVGADEDWSIGVTGHSLGASLAALFGFYAAADGRFNKNGKPIEVFSFASPYVGDSRYRSAFKHLEKSGKIVHARFCNKHDIVTYEPSFSPEIDFSKVFRIFEWDVAFYHHTGLQIQLMLDDDKPASVKYPFKENIVADFKRGLDYFMPFSLPYAFSFGDFHSVDEYQRRMKEELKRVVSDNLDIPIQEYYKEKGIVGTK